MKALTFKRLLLVFFAISCASAAHAGDFSMGSSSLVTQIEPQNDGGNVHYTSSEPIGMSGDSGARSMLGSIHTDMPSGISEPRQSASDADDQNVNDRNASPQASGTAARTTAPTAPVGVNKSRSGSRWQSLVPGAIR